MKLDKIKKEIQKYQYFEDTGIIDVTLASLIATRLNLGDPVWLVIIGASSGGKSQIIRPMSLTDKEYLHRIDDLTENTFLSAKHGGNKGKNSVSLLHRIGTRGIIVMSDLTVLFSKNSDSKNAILSQFRMIYDGEMTKQSGNDSKPNTWTGRLGLLSGGTPSLYSSFEEVSDMGERFVYYRMKEFDPKKAMEVALKRTMFGHELDEKMSELYGKFIMGVVKKCKDTEFKLSKDVSERIQQVSLLAEKIRANSKTDWKGEMITKLPQIAMPMRTVLQLQGIAKGLMAMNLYNNGDSKLAEKDLQIIDWCAYSFANEEKRACLDVIAKVSFNSYLRTQTIADKIGLSTSVVQNILQTMGASGVLVRNGDSNNLSWALKDEGDWEVLRRILDVKKSEVFQEREITTEEINQMNDEEVNLDLDF